MGAFELALAVFVFSVAAAWTPGPNTMMLAASGANFGFWRSLPHQAGILLGMTALLSVSLAGIGAAIQAAPGLRLGLQLAGAAWLLYLAWRIATAAPPAEKAEAGRPLTLFEAAGFQFVNPKAWSVALGMASTFTAPALGPLLGGTVAVAAFLVAALPGCAVWVLFGMGIRRLLHSRARLRAFNVTMGVLLAASVLLILDLPPLW